MNNYERKQLEFETEELLNYVARPTKMSIRNPKALFHSQHQKVIIRCLESQFICLALISLTLLDMPKWWKAVFLVSGSFTTIQLQETELSLPSFVNSSTTHHPNGVLKAKGPPSLVGSTSSGSNAFKQFAPMSNPISVLVSFGNLSAMIFKCSHFLAFS